MKLFFGQILLKISKPITYLSTMWLRYIKSKGDNEKSNKIFMKLGLFPILDHYYQPLINPRKYLKKSLREDRNLKGINFNTKEQLDILSKFDFNNELLDFPEKKQSDLEYYYDNESYKSGDSEYLYNMIRHFQPKRIIEIGSGYSTLMARNAIEHNKVENTEYKCEHICIEPFEKPWLVQIDVKLIRKKVEDIDISFFQKLEKNDILFIDSSHIIRPQGDVLFEYLEILPNLNSGVLVHIHDIFTPKDYLDDWVYKHHLFWNEQYLLEAFISFNSEFRVIGALNYLSHNFKTEFSSKCPIYSKQGGREPGAFWLIKN